MTDAGFFRGTSTEQDNRFSDKEKKLLKSIKFAENLTKKVDMTKVKLDTVKPWITNKITELLNGMEDDVVVDYVFNQLEADKNPDARRMQINLTGFLNGKSARIFMSELWDLLLSAQESSAGIPEVFMAQKKEEIKKRMDEQTRVQESVKKSDNRDRDRRPERDNNKERNNDDNRRMSRDRSRSPITIKREDSSKGNNNAKKDEHHHRSPRRPADHRRSPNKSPRRRSPFREKSPPARRRSPIRSPPRRSPPRRSSPRRSSPSVRNSRVSPRRRSPIRRSPIRNNRSPIRRRSPERRRSPPRRANHSPAPRDRSPDRRDRDCHARRGLESKKEDKPGTVSGLQAKLMKMAGQDTSNLAIVKVSPPKRRSPSVSSRSSSSRSSSHSSSRSPSPNKVQRKDDSIHNKRNYRGRQSSSPDAHRRSGRPIETKIQDRKKEVKEKPVPAQRGIKPSGPLRRSRSLSNTPSPFRKEGQKELKKRSVTRSPDARIKKDKRREVELESMEKLNKKRMPSPSPTKKKKRRSSSVSEESEAEESETEQSSPESTPEKKKRKKKKKKKESSSEDSEESVDSEEEEKRRKKKAKKEKKVKREKKKKEKKKKLKKSKSKRRHDSDEESEEGVATPSLESEALEKQLREKALQSLSRRKEQRN